MPGQAAKSAVETPFRMTVVPRPAASEKFQPIAQPAAEAGQANSPCREPNVIVNREGQRITSIRVECSCGQVIDLACEYSS